eukprot:scaffold126485_cov35-Attheya_sp.AAC.1
MPVVCSIFSGSKAPMNANRPGLEPRKGAGSISIWEEIMGNQWRKQWITVGKDGSDFNHSTSVGNKSWAIV